MIKTMLLTAQLALSPIVGTNGLQPKRLPNPVYGETTITEVTYQGNKYVRVMDKDAYGSDLMPPSGEKFLGFSSWADRNELTIYSNIFDEGNLAHKDPSLAKFDLTANNDIYKFINFEMQDQAWSEEMGEDTPLPSFCFSYWLEGEDQLDYFEVFVKQGQYTATIISEWTGGPNNWTLSEQWQDNLYLIEGTTLYTHDRPNWNLGQWTRTIPNYQPKEANPSVYDNIYNFYYQNLFANEALNELGAQVGNNSLTMRQWLAHTATIVSISLLACALVILVIKIFKLIAGSISDIWG